MKKNCKNCKKEFEVRKEDLNFYEKIKSPAPNYCPDCRVMRRLAFRNERTLYKRTCSKTGKPIVSLYPENTPLPFFDQMLELKNKVPRISLLAINCANSEYVNNTEDSRNCYLIFAAQKNEDCLYCRLLYRSKFVVDGAFVADSELCYECIDVRKSYKCMFAESCETRSDLLFCFDLRDCQNCIFSTNLRNKSYHIFNKPVPREEFEAKKKEILSSY